MKNNGKKKTDAPESIVTADDVAPQETAAVEVQQLSKEALTTRWQIIEVEWQPEDGDSSKQIGVFLSDEAGLKAYINLSPDNAVNMAEGLLQRARLIRTARAPEWIAPPPVEDAAPQEAQ